MPDIHMSNSSTSDPIWKRSFDIEWLNRFSDHCMVSHVGIEFVEIGNNFLRARMPVDERTTQPLGLLHGGASVTLAETLGSTAAHCSVDETHYCVGIEINANHIRGATSGYVEGITRPIRRGKRTHVWETRSTDSEGRLLSTSRMTLAVLEKEQAQ